MEERREGEKASPRRWCLTQECWRKRTMIARQVARVVDPELFVPITDLGLLYNVLVSEKGEAEIHMTLTTMGCPLFHLLEEDIRRKASAVSGVKEVSVKLVFDPPWDVRMIAPATAERLGIT